jgi:hypothetical protein
MVVVMQEVLRQFESGELVAGGDSSKDSRPMKVREVSIGRTPWNSWCLRLDVRDAEGMIRRGEQLHHGPPTGGVALINSSKEYFNELM